MKKFFSSVFLLFTILLFSASTSAQESNFQFYGNVRLAHIGNDTEASGLGGDNTLLRIRPGVKYFFNENHSFSGRLVYLVSKEAEPFEFTIKANGNRQLAYGSLSFDEFYYQYTKEDFLLKMGRFQKSISVLSNAGRSHLRFQSNANFVHWSDGLYLKKGLNSEWFGEAIIEYQNRDALSFPYKANLNYGNSEHNFNYYLGAENRTRDQNNIIQKGFGIFFAPNAYSKPDGFSTYVALASRITFDFPAEDVLKGGSFRIVGELGQNLNTEFKNGTSAVTSFGINKYAEKHELMVEFASTDSQWLTASPYGVNSEEIEIRYRFIFRSDLNFDIRYRIRESRSDIVPTQYSTFLRATYSF
ncbi:hypothetical protein GYB29_14165 [bacterium]|nr:hypothetical protein [bacterium]